MSAQITPFKRQLDMLDERMQLKLQANVSMLAAMHDALMEISHADLTLDGGMTAKSIADEAIRSVNIIAFATEPLFAAKRHSISIERISVAEARTPRDAEARTQRDAEARTQ